MKGLPDALSVQSDPGPVYNWNSPLLDKPRALASSIVNPFFSVLLTGPYGKKKSNINHQNLTFLFKMLSSLHVSH